MSRPIEFRCWDVEQKQMIIIEGFDYNRIKNELFPFSVVFMQFTGLADKNGTKIFEGDIVKYKDYIDVYTTVHAGNGLIKWENGAFVIMEKDGHPRGISEWVEKLHLQVMGNEFENPELLTRIL